jgi:hypothetical protein
MQSRLGDCVCVFIKEILWNEETAREYSYSQ